MKHRRIVLIAALASPLLACGRPSMITDTPPMEEEIRSYVRTDLRAGFYSDEETLDLVSGIFEDEYGEETVLEAAGRILVEERKILAQEQQSWPEVTDCDRLDRAFAALEEQEILARQNYTDCGTCGAAAIWTEIEDARENGRPIRGYVFFHEQDTDAAATGYGLCLSYGAFEEGEAAALVIANEIVDTLEAHDLPVQWDGTWEQRICVPLEWQKR